VPPGPLSAMPSRKIGLPGAGGRAIRFYTLPWGRVYRCYPSRGSAATWAKVEVEAKIEVEVEAKVEAKVEIGGGPKPHFFHAPQSAPQDEDSEPASRLRGIRHFY